MSSFTSDIVMAGICKKEAFVTFPTENSVPVPHDFLGEFEKIVSVLGRCGVPISCAILGALFAESDKYGIYLQLFHKNRQLLVNTCK